MGLALKKEADIFDREAFLAWEAEQDTKHEYQRGEIVAMVGARKNHVLATGALFSTLRSHLRGSPCQVFASDMKLLIEAADAYYYPDVMVSCSEADRQADLALTEPCLIAEVLSDSTASHDRGRKFASYRLIPSLRDYLIIDTDARRIELYSRADEGWLLRETTPAQGRLHLASIDLTLDAADVFADLPEPAAPTPKPSDERLDDTQR